MKENYVLETDIYVSFPNVEEEGIYDLHCYDGYATGERTCDTEDCPKHIKMTYPTIKEVLEDEEMAGFILRYRGLRDLSASDIHYGDIMLH